MQLNVNFPAAENKYINHSSLCNCSKQHDTHSGSLQSECWTWYTPPTEYIDNNALPITQNSHEVCESQTLIQTANCEKLADYSCHTAAHAHSVHCRRHTKLITLNTHAHKTWHINGFHLKTNEKQRQISTVNTREYFSLCMIQMSCPCVIHEIINGHHHISTKKCLCECKISLVKSPAVAADIML